MNTVLNTISLDTIANSTSFTSFLVACACYVSRGSRILGGRSLGMQSNGCPISYFRKTSGSLLNRSESNPCWLERILCIAIRHAQKRLMQKQHIDNFVISVG